MSAASPAAKPPHDIRPAATVEPARLHEAFTAAFSDYLIGAFRLPLAHWPQLLARHAVDLAESRVAFDAEGRISAFALVAPRPELAGWRLATMGAPPSARGSGAAAALLDDFVARARGAGLSMVELECFAQNERALRLYRSRGFAPLHPLYGYGRTPDAAQVLPVSGGAGPVDPEAAFRSLDDLALRLGDLPLQVTGRSLRALAAPAQAWCCGAALAVFTQSADASITLHSLVDESPQQHDAEALAAALLARHPASRFGVPQLQRPDLGGAALERLGFERAPLHQWLMRRAL